MKKLSARYIVVLTGLAALACLVAYFNNATTRLPCGHRELHWRVAACKLGLLTSQPMGECLRVGDAVARWKENREPADFDTILQHLFRDATVDMMLAALGEPDWSIGTDESPVEGASYELPVNWYYAISEISIAHVSFDASARVAGFGSRHPPGQTESAK